MRKIALAVCILVAFAIGSQADTITFVPPDSPAVGSWGTASQTVGDIEIHGYYLSGSTFVDTGGVTLFGRNQANDHGVGICDPSEAMSCGSGSGGGDYNELSNAHAFEVIRLTLPDGYVWDSVQVSSLDKNGSTDPAKFERGQLWGSSFADPNVADSNSTLLCDFVTGGAANNFCTVGTGFEPVLDLSGHQNDKYLFFAAQDWSGGSNTNNDYLVYAATITQTPEPGSLSLLAAGLVGGIGLLRRKFLA